MTKGDSKTSYKNSLSTVRLCPELPNRVIRADKWGQIIEFYTIDSSTAVLFLPPRRTASVVNIIMEYRL